MSADNLSPRAAHIDYFYRKRSRRLNRLTKSRQPILATAMRRESTMSPDFSKCPENHGLTYYLGKSPETYTHLTGGYLEINTVNQ